MKLTMPGNLWAFFYAPNASDFYNDEVGVPMPDRYRRVGKIGTQAVWDDIPRHAVLKIFARAQSFVELYLGGGVDEDAVKDGRVFKRWLSKELPRLDIQTYTTSDNLWIMADEEYMK